MGLGPCGCRLSIVDRQSVVSRGVKVLADVRVGGRELYAPARFVFFLQVFGCYGNNNDAADMQGCRNGKLEQVPDRAYGRCNAEMRILEIFGSS
jgi:hypothetical protein